MTVGEARNKPPGRVILCLTAIDIALLLFLHFDWWPSRFGNMTDIDRFFFGAPLVLLLAIVGLVWAIRALHVVGQDRRWSWRIIEAPAVVALALGIVLIVPMPTFEDARPELEKVARHMLEQGQFSRDDFAVNGIDISNVMRRNGDEVYFVDADATGFTTSAGWVYSPHGAPAGYDDFSSSHISGPWYRYQAVWRD